MNTQTKSVLISGFSPRGKSLFAGLILMVGISWTTAQSQASDAEVVLVTESTLTHSLKSEVNCAAHDIQEMGSSELYQRWSVALEKVKDRQKKWQQSKWLKGFRYRSFLKSLSEFRDLTDLLNISLLSRVTERALEVKISWPFKGSMMPVNDFLLVHPSFGHIDLETFGQVPDLSLKVENEVLTLRTNISPLEYCAKVPLLLQLNNAIFKTKD